MEQCFEYTKKLHNGEVKSKNHWTITYFSPSMGLF
jgi:hypothetical protein